VNAIANDDVACLPTFLRKTVDFVTRQARNQHGNRLDSSSKVTQMFAKFFAEAERPLARTAGFWQVGRCYATFPRRETFREGPLMDILTAEQLTEKKCVPCEGGVPKLTREEAEAFLKNVSGWTLTPDGIRIRREWRVKNFLGGLDFFQKVAEVAEAEGHHPDLHLVGYRNVAIEIWTHAIGGLSENDFILAAKIDALPVKLAKA
jgi:4a-hydroxytetrahydrobiopterin dehydratase